MLKRSRMRSLFALLIVSLFITGCNEKPKYAKEDINLVLVDSDSKVLLKRALEYWNLHSQKKFEQSYQFEMPYQRYIYSLEQYQNFNAPNYKEYTIIIEKISIHGSEATLNLKYRLDKRRFSFKDKWIKIKDKWYHQMKTKKLPVSKPI